MKRGFPSASSPCMGCWLGQMIPGGVVQVPALGAMSPHKEGIVLLANNIASRESISGYLS